LRVSSIHLMDQNHKYFLDKIFMTRIYSHTVMRVRTKKAKGPLDSSDPVISKSNTRLDREIGIHYFRI
jgi:hypothetical protein